MRTLFLFLFFALHQITAYSQNIKNQEYNDTYIKEKFKIKNYAISPDNQYIAVYSNATVYIVDAQKKQLLQILKPEDLNNSKISRMIFSPNSPHLYVNLINGGLRKYTMQNKGYQRIGPVMDKSISFGISNDGTLLSILALKTEKKSAFWANLGNSVLNSSILLSDPEKNKEQREHYEFFNTNRKKGFSYRIYIENQKGFHKKHLEGYSYALKNIAIKKIDYNELYRYVIVKNTKKAMQLIAPSGNAVLLQGTSRKGLPKKINKRPVFFNRDMSYDKGFNHPKVHYTYQKLGLFKTLEFHKNNSDKIYKEEKVIAPKYQLVHQTLEALSWNGTPAKLEIPKQEQDIVLYTGTKTQNTTNTFTFENVDTPPTKTVTTNYKRYALIIGNEKYDHFLNPEFTQNDARMFKTYSQNVLGIPNNNIFYLENGTATAIKNQFLKVLKALALENGQAEFFFYYAGHIEIDSQKNKCLIAVDTPDNDLKHEIKFNYFLADLFKIPTKRNFLFLDACFAGSARNSDVKDNSIASRGRIIRRYKKDVLQGNTILFASSKNFEKSYAHKQLKHGIFTYNLLLKLKQSQKGALPVSELQDFITKQVPLTALKLDSPEQNPMLEYSPTIKNAWKNWNIKP